MERDECFQKAIQLTWDLNLCKSLLLWTGEREWYSDTCHAIVGIHSFAHQVWRFYSLVCKVCLILTYDLSWKWCGFEVISPCEIVWDLQQRLGPACQLPCVGIAPLKSVQTSWGFWTHKCNYCYNNSIKEVIIIFTLSFHFKMRKWFPLGSVKVIYIMHNNGLHGNIIIIHLYGTIWALEALQTHVRKGPCLEELTGWIASIAAST